MGNIEASAGPSASAPVLVHFAQVSAALQCVQVMKGRKFDERSIGAKCITEDAFEASKGQVPSAADSATAQPTASAISGEDAQNGIQATDEISLIATDLEENGMDCDLD
jgi:hypothetical protein